MGLNGTGQAEAGDLTAEYTAQERAAHFHDLSTTTERVAFMVFQLLEGAEYTTRDVARLTSMTWQGADEMLNKASRVVPITKYNTRWRRFDNET